MSTGTRKQKSLKKHLHTLRHLFMNFPTSGSSAEAENTSLNSTTKETEEDAAKMAEVSEGMSYLDFAKAVGIAIIPESDEPETDDVLSVASTCVFPAGRERSLSTTSNHLASMSSSTATTSAMSQLSFAGSRRGSILDMDWNPSSLSASASPTQPVLPTFSISKSPCSSPVMAPAYLFPRPQSFTDDVPLDVPTEHIEQRGRFTVTRRKSTTAPGTGTGRRRFSVCTVAVQGLGVEQEQPMGDCFAELGSRSMPSARSPLGISCGE
ncbi:MAG: hypothetical protein SGCHY_005341 [Lobulomycetales sp.]